MALIPSHVADRSDKITDGEIIGRILSGRINDFEVLLNRYRGYVFKIVSGLLPPDAVPDLSQEIFLAVYKSLPQYDERKMFKKWLACIAIHRCYDYWRLHYRNTEIPISALTEDHQRWLDEVVSAPSRDAFDHTETQKEMQEILQRALADLSAEDRMVITLVHLEGLSIKEAAEVLGWSSINVKVRIHRSRKKMRKRIETMLAGGA
ncbi:MAG: RNA polymerase sigma factor [Smithella sp.]|jgi:RNA polymerase sigma-70 factor (ECF subfamily)